MKRKLSVFSMIAGHSLGKVFWILLSVPVLNGIFFWDRIGQGYQPVYQLLDDPTVLGLFTLSLVLLTAVLCAALRDKGGSQNCFLNRLRISPRRLFWNHTLYNGLCFLLLFALEAMSLLAIALWSSLRFPEFYNHQRLMLDCYQSCLLHTFFPLSDWLAWVVLAVLIFCLGICTAAMPTLNRRGKRTVSPLLLVGTVVLYGHLALETHSLSLDVKVIALVFALLFSLPALYNGNRQEVTEDA